MGDLCSIVYKVTIKVTVKFVIKKYNYVEMESYFLKVTSYNIVTRYRIKKVTVTITSKKSNAVISKIIKKITCNCIRYK